MTWIDIIGLLGSISIGLSFVPQTYKTIRIKTIQSTSFFMFLTSFFASIGMIIYSVHYKIIPMLIANVSVLTNSCIIMLVYLYKKNISTINETKEITKEITVENFEII
jgi:uncharacterized protein with PQ loop repeat